MREEVKNLIKVLGFEALDPKGTYRNNIEPRLYISSNAMYIVKDLYELKSDLNKKSNIILEYPIDFNNENSIVTGYAVCMYAYGKHQGKEEVKHKVRIALGFNS